MKWSRWRSVPWIDTRARFVAAVPRHGFLLDLGSSDGKTLCHFAELRPDLRFAAADIGGAPDKYPPGTEFAKLNFETDRLPWNDSTFDSVTCMHVVEHLHDVAHIVREVARVLKPGGAVYIETPDPKSLDFPSPVGAGTEHVTMNFFDDSTHVRPVPTAELREIAAGAGLKPVRSGASRNWIFFAAFPVLYLLKPQSRARYVAELHWTGWSAYIIAAR